MALIPDVCITSWRPCGCGWSTGDLWYCWDSLERATVILITFMAANTLITTCHRIYQDRIARRQTIAFTRDSAEAVRDGRLGEVIAVAARNKRSPLANAVSASLIAFASAPAEFSNSDAIATAERAFQRARSLLAVEMKRGLSALSSIAACGVLIGVLGTCFGVLYAFRGTGMEKHTWIARVNSDLARAVAITGLGLIVSILAILCRSALRRTAEVFEHEMSNAKLDMVANFAIRSRGQHRPEQGSDDALVGFLLVTPGDSAAPLWEVPYERQQPLSLAMCVYGLYVALDVIYRVVH